MSAADRPPAPPDGGGDPFAPLLARATRRLRADSDVQLEVAQELRGHLEDSAAEFRAAGQTDADAAASAARALGDADALADDLWRANRRRLRGRVAARWAVALVAAPAVLAVSASILWSLLTSLSILTLLSGMSATQADSRFSLEVGLWPAAWAWDDLRGRLDPADQLLVAPHFFSIDRIGSEEEIERARQAAEQAPGDSVLYANYVTRSLTRPGPFAGERADPAELDALLTRLARGAASEPDNGYYPLLRAAALLDASSRTIVEPEELQPGYDRTAPDGTVEPVRFERLDVTDPARFDEGLAALHAAAGKPYVDSHVEELTARLLRRFPRATRLSDYLLREEFSASTLLPHLNLYRSAVNHAGQYAIGLAERGGDGARVDAILADERRIGLLVTARTTFGSELYVGWGVRELAVEHEAVADQVRGRTAARDRAAAAAEALIRQLGEAQAARFDGSPEAMSLREQSGVTQSFGLDRSRVEARSLDLAPGRRAEYAVADQAALAVLLLGLLVAAGACGAASALTAAVARRRGDAPPAPFIGWRRVLRVVLLGGVLPLAAYWAYGWLTPLSGRGRGLIVTAPRVLFEYAAVGATVALLLRVLIARAVHARLAELGLPVNAPRPAPWQWAAEPAFALAVVAAAAAWQLRPIPPDQGRSIWLLGHPAESLAACVAAYVVIQLGAASLALRWWRRRARRRAAAPSTAPGSAPASTGATSRSVWRRPLPGSLGGVLALAAGLSVLILWELPSRQGNAEPVFAAVAMTCALTMAIQVAAGWAAGLGVAALAGRATVAEGDAVRYARAVARSSAVAYAVTATVVATLGVAALRAQERRAVGRFDAAGYGLLHEVDSSAFRALRDDAARELQRALPPPTPSPARPPAL